ncbi:glycosyltransferase [Streptomyces sp. NPDC007148]|uniref:glycosyltransferase n=1 Tax=Streptomyces sp. NPDC007148 TaxID=3364775 RepID=UPI0036AF99AE
MPQLSFRKTRGLHRADRPTSWTSRLPRLSLLAFVITGSAAAYVISGTLHLYGMAAIGLLSVKLLLSLTYRPYQAARTADVQGAAPNRLDLVAIIPTYNEDPSTLRRSLRSILAQSRPVSLVHVVDDASGDLSAVRAAEEMAEQFARAGIGLRIHRQTENKGKREALAVGFRASPGADAYLCVDSDTVLDPQAVEELIKPLSNRRVKAVTGLVLALNQRKNLLTRLIDLRYGNAFLFERAAYSRLGSVLCCCGSLVVYRADVVHANLDDFLTQKFLGRPAVFGDDRRLTNYSLMRGQVLFQSTAVAYTAVPERLGHFLRQQVRWNKSFFRESQWALRNLPRLRPGWYLTFLEVATWLVFTGAALTSLAVKPATDPGNIPAHLAGYLVFTAVMGYARSVRYLDVPRPGVTFVGRLGIYSLAPLYGLLHLVLLLPIRIYAMLTMTRGKWGTRQTGVEVTDDAAATAGLYRALQDASAPQPAPVLSSFPHQTALDTRTSASYLSDSPATTVGG